jgi:hypothetical protein
MYYSGNRFLTLDEMKTNALYIYDFLIIRGWTINAICGMLGNMQTESTINPAIWQSLDDGNTAGGFGLVQWTPSTKYTNWCTTYSLNYLLMDSNLLRIIYEVENNIQWIHSTMSFEEFTLSEDTPYNLAMLFLAHYERPADPDQPNRGAQANFWYEYITNTDPPTPTPYKRKKLKPFIYLRKRRIFL